MWFNFFGAKRGISSETRREVVLQGALHDAQGVSLKQLRKFVKELEGWPGSARVRKTSGAFIAVSYTETAPDLLNIVVEEES